MFKIKKLLYICIFLFVVILIHRNNLQAYLNEKKEMPYQAEYSSFNMAITLKVGMGLSYLLNLNNAKSKTVFFSGLGFAFHLKDPFSIDFSSNFQLKGGQGTLQDYNLKYFSFLLSGKIRIIEHLHLLLGPELAILHSASVNGRDVTQYTNKQDFSIVFGMSYYFLIGRDRLVFDFLIDVGLLNTIKQNHPYTKLEVYNRSAYVTVGWEFSL